MRRFDHLVLVLVWLLTIALPSVSTPANIRHFGELDYDKDIRCEARIFGRPILWDYALRTEQVMAPCPAARSELQKSLADKDVTVAFMDDWVFLLPTHRDNSLLLRLAPDYKPVDLGKLLVRWETKNFAAPGIPGSRTLTGSELKEIEKRILQAGRMIPVAEPISNTGDFAIPLELTVDCHRLSRNAPESVIATLQERPVSNPGRLYYGELRDGHFDLLWDSPIIHARLLHMGYMDVDGDGVQEILLNSFVPGNATFPALVILDREGNELTRQNDCDVASLELFGADNNGADTVCPIVGNNFKLLDPVNGKRDLAVERLEYQGSGTQIFRLLGGRYAPWPPLPDTSKSKARALALNEKGMADLKEQNYGIAAGEFILAAFSDSSSALYPNNVGFAYYKMRRYQESLVWLRKALDIDPRRAVAYLNLGDAYAELHRNSEAREAYKNTSNSPLIPRLPPT